MQDRRWPQIKQALVAAGWVWRDDTLYAPHETLWFQTSARDPDWALFRDATAVQRAVDHAALHADLVSLVEALDSVLDN